MLNQLKNIVAAHKSMLTESSGFTDGPDDNSLEKMEAAVVFLGGLVHSDMVFFLIGITRMEKKGTKKEYY